MIEGSGRGREQLRRLTLAPELCDALSGFGYEEPAPIQRAAIRES
jgi:hypothetical protein